MGLHIKVRYGSVEVNVLSAIKLYPFYENSICLFADLVANADVFSAAVTFRRREGTAENTSAFADYFADISVFYAVNNDV